MGLFFVSKRKYKNLEVVYRKMKESRDYFKFLFDSNKETTDMLTETIGVLNTKIKDLIKQRDNAEGKYRKLLSSNGGFSTANKKLKKEIKELKADKKPREQKVKADINLSIVESRENKNKRK